MTRFEKIKKMSIEEYKALRTCGTTDFERVKEMSIDEFVQQIATCRYCVYNNPEEITCIQNCFNGTKKWLEMEVDDADQR